MRSNHVLHVTFRLERLLPVRWIARRIHYLAAWTLTSWSFCICSFLRCLHLKAATLFRSLLILLFSSSSKESWEKKNRRKIVSFLPVTLYDILNILAYTYCFTKPQNNKVLFKTPALNKAIKLEVNLLGIRLNDRSTYHFNLGSFWFEMRHSIQSLSHSSCFYRVSKTHFHFSFSASCQRNKFGVARSSIFARNLF